MKKVSIEQENQVIDLYKSGLSCKSIELELGINSVTVFHILKRNNIPTRTKGGIEKLPIDEIVEDYKNGIRITEISKKFNVSYKTIYNYLENNNIERNYIYINQNLNRHYFYWMDSYDKAYFIGLLISDGSVVGNTVSISLNQKDEKILHILSAKIGNENPLYYDKRGMVTLHFKSKEIVNDLALYGIVPNKTLSTRMPYCFDIEIMSHLIRGLIDGDGWISFKGHNIGFCAGNYEIVKDVRDFLVWALNVYNVAIVKSATCYMIQWSSKKDIEIIGNYLYHNKKDCYIERKYNNFVQIIIHDNTEITN